MTAVYKSKNTEYMQKLKKAVLTGMKGNLPEEKEYTWDYVRKQVTLDDLQTYTVGELGRLVSFPVKNFNADIVAVFMNRPTDAEINILGKMMKARAIPEGKVYTTWVNKAQVFTAEEKTLLDNTINAELTIIEPKLVLSFGVPFIAVQHAVSDFKNAKVMVTYDMDWLFKGEQEGDLQERKTALWNDVVELTKHYNKN